MTCVPNTLQPMDFIRLWLHECNRVFSDRLINENDVGAFQELSLGVAKKHFPDADHAKVAEEPLLFTKFVEKDPKLEGAYIPVCLALQIFIHIHCFFDQV